MAEILQEYTIARRILPPDTLPWPQLVLASVIEKLRDRYKFEEVGRAEEPNEPIVGKMGEFVVDAIPQAVQLLALEPNVVHTQTTGGSAIAEALFEDIGEFIRELSQVAICQLDIRRHFKQLQ